MPEVGGDLAQYFDPWDDNNLVKALIEGHARYLNFNKSNFVNHVSYFSENWLRMAELMLEKFKSRNYVRGRFVVPDKSSLNKASDFGNLFPRIEIHYGDVPIFT